MDHSEVIGALSGAQKFGNFISKLRVKRGFSIVQFAARVGVNSSYLSQVERGTRIPTDDIIRNIAEYFKMDENILFDMAGRVPLAAKEELENQKLLQTVIKEITKIKLPEQKKQEIYQEFFQIVQRIAYS
jgi:transcriptional regulator with XRE-family HTH domain